MKFGQQTIGIIGDTGAAGKWLRRFFECLGFSVIGSSLFSSAISNRSVVKRSDVVIFAVTLSEMVPVIRSLLPYSRPEQLWMDVGSRKKEIVDEMLKSAAEVVGLHPLYAPPTSMVAPNQNLVFCPARLREWTVWVAETLEHLENRVVVCLDPAHHDAMMIPEQNVPQAAIIASAEVMADSGASVSELIEYSTVASRKMLSLIAGVLGNTPEVYAQIQTESAEGIAALDKLIASLQRLRNMAAEGRDDDIVALLKRLRAFYGENFIAAGKKGFPR